MSYGSCYGIPFRFGSGILGPAAPDEVIQFLQGGVLPDGITVIDELNILTEPVLRDIACIQFTADAAIIDTNECYIIGTKPFRLSIWYNAGIVQNSAWASIWTGGGNFFSFLWRGLAAGTYQMITYNDAGTTVTSTVDTSLTPSSGWHKVEFSRVGTVGTWKIDDAVVASTGSVIADMDEPLAPPLAIGGRWNNYSGYSVSAGIKEIALFEFELDGVLVSDYPLQEGEGYLCYDRAHIAQPAHIATYSTDLQDTMRNVVADIPSVNAQGGFSTTNVAAYDAFLLAMADAVPTIEDRTNDTADTYSAVASAARATLVTNGWTLTDGGLA